MPWFNSRVLRWRKVETRSCHFEEALALSPFVVCWIEKKHNTNKVEETTQKKGKKAFFYSSRYILNILVTTKGFLSEKKCNRRKKKPEDVDEILFIHRGRKKVELRNTKALLTRQSCFPLFALNTSVDIRMTGKAVKEKSAVFPGNPKGLYSCEAVIWLAPITTVHQRPKSSSNSQLTVRLALEKVFFLAYVHYMNT